MWSYAKIEQVKIEFRQKGTETGSEYGVKTEKSRQINMVLRQKGADK